MCVTSLRACEGESPVSRHQAVVLPVGEPGGPRGTLLVHVGEQDKHLVVGDVILAIPVYIGQPGMEAAIFASTLTVSCTQTIVLGGVTLDLSPDLLQEIGAALQRFVKYASVP